MTPERGRPPAARFPEADSGAPLIMPDARRNQSLTVTRDTKLMSKRRYPATLTQWVAIATLVGWTTAAMATPPKEQEAVMQAALIHDGSVRIQTVPVPEPGRGQVRVQVHAIGVNPVDWKRAVPENNGKVAGRDFAGVIDAVGPDAGRWKVGDAVIGVAASDSGSYAQYTIATTDAIADKPAALTWEEAAGLPVVSETAWRAMVTVGDVQPGQRVLVHGGAGGVGSMAVQIAKARGAYVIATASPRNHDYLRSLGGDETIDYNTTPFEQVAQNIDLVLNTTNPEVTARSVAVINRGGTLVSIVGQPPEEACQAAGIRGATTGLATGEMLPHVVELVNAGKLGVHISHRMPFAEAAQAWKQSQTGHTRGKITLVVVPD